MNKGTLTILSDTQAIIGCPNGDVVYSASQRGQFQADVLLWLDAGGVLALPFPVEVVDMRRLETPHTVTINQTVDEATAKTLQGTLYAAVLKQGE